ncbi:MAG: polysaccharide deacetylase family protein [Clostridia bacterium]|nr:polysaccharide deacetylase family protein [Clostridia bacterium]
MKIDLNFFPGFTRKAMSFTIDDGHVPLDIKFIDIVKPHGFLGTFNICHTTYKGFTHEDYRRIYEGFEIANHCKNHPFAIPDGVTPKFSDESFSGVENPDPDTLYKSEVEGMWRGVKGKFCTAAEYIRFIKEAQAELEEVFGEGSVGAFVWPYGEQQNTEVKEYLKSAGYYAVRKTGLLEDKLGFNLPTDRMAWIYNTGYKNLLSVAEKFEAYSDDGNLKVFFFGIHSHDFENNNTWHELREFAERYGDRPDDYYYATNKQVFDYEDATKSAYVKLSDIRQ